MVSATASRSGNRNVAAADVLKFVSDITMATGLIVAIAAIADMPGPAAFQALVIFAAIAALITRSKIRPGSACRLGPADKVTLVRAVIAALCAGLVFRGETAVQLGWWLPAIAGIALALDGLDGWIARSTGTASVFGARFDMETDAFLILVLSALVWQTGKTGAWILAIGAMRYGFVAAAAIWPRLGSPLPPGRRRQAVCVIQVCALLICLMPVTEPRPAAAVSAFALIALTGSFSTDIAWLLRHGGGRAASGP